METAALNVGERRIVRRIALEAAPSGAQVEAASVRLSGAAHIHVHPVSPRVVCVAYRVSEIGYAAVLRALESSGLKPRSGWWQRLRAAWLDYLDTNARAHRAAAPGGCCARPDGIYGNRGGPRR